MDCITFNKELHGTFSYPDGFADMIDGLKIEEQLNFFHIGNGLYRKEPVSER